MMYISRRRGNYGLELEAIKSSEYGYAINTTLLIVPKWRIGFVCQYKPLWRWRWDSDVIAKTDGMYFKSWAGLVEFLEYCEALEARRNNGK